VHARRVRSATRAIDRRRLGAAILSGIVPGLGQASNRDGRLALLFGVPALGLILVLWLVVSGSTMTRLLASLMVPSTLGPVLALNVLVLAWRLVAVGQAFFAAPGRPGPRPVAGLAIVALLIALPQAYAGWVGYSAFDNFKRVFGGGSAEAGSTPGPGPTERLNILLLGVDSASGRAHALTDTLIVVSLDPVGRTVSMVSIPRDLVNVPLGNGSTYGPKINSLLGFANRNPGDFAGGGRKAVKRAVGALLGVPIHYYAEVNLGGFVRMVDAVGGVDVQVDRALADPDYGGFGVGPGWSITKGPHHLNGANALAYARIRKSAGESDFTRAERQQEVLVSIRNAAVKRNLLFSLTGLLDAVGDTVRTDLPAERLPGLAALAEEIGEADTTRVVLGHPLVAGGSNRYGAVQIPDLPAIRAVAASLFTKPGTPPTAWPTPRPTARPAPPKPSKSAGPTTAP
jgi:LCP family protein required for cell wall assembly